MCQVLYLKDDFKGGFMGGTEQWSICRFFVHTRQFICFESMKLSRRIRSLNKIARLDKGPEDISFVGDEAEWR